jgi:Fe-S-cluster containining protein
VWVTLSDIDHMAAELAMSAEEFFQRYVRVVEGAYSLKERSNGDCILFAEKVGCRAYSSRPIQCRTFPFWPEYVNTPAGWERAARRCPAVNSGELHPANEVALFLEVMLDSGW